MYNGALTTDPAPETVSVSIKIPKAQAEILQSRAAGLGQELGDMLTTDKRPPEMIVNDHLNQGFWAQVNAGSYPADTVAFVKDQDAKKATALKAAAPLPAGA